MTVKNSDDAKVNQKMHALSLCPISVLQIE